MNRIKITAKCSDLCSVSGVIDNNIIDYDGYVPDMFGYYGDYITIEINADTMEILSVGPNPVENGKLTGISKEDIINLE